MQNDKFMPPPQPPGYGYPSAPQEGFQAQNYGPPPPHNYGPPPPQHFGPPPPQHFNPPPPQHFGPPPPQYFGPPPAQSYGPPPPQNHGTVPPPPPPAVTVVERPIGWYNRNQHNRPQSNAVGGASLIFMSGGMNIAWSVGFRNFLYMFIDFPTHTLLAWFIGAIIGVVLSCILANRVPKKTVLVFCSALVLIGGIVRAATRYNLEAIEAALYLDGIANGLAFAPTLALIGEVSVPFMRGKLGGSIEQTCFMTGFFIQIVYVTAWGVSFSSFTVDQLHGILSAIYGLIALIMTALLTIESPVIMLANGEEQQAIDALRRLQRPFTITNETYALLEEHKRYLAQNKDLSLMQSVLCALPAFLRISYLRILNAMSLSVTVYYALLLSLRYNTRSSYVWQFTVFGICRWLGATIVGMSLDSAGRKKPTLLGLLVVGGFSFGVASIVSDYPYGPVTTIFPLLCIIQLFAGFAFVGTSAYLTEAYPLGVKQHFIGFTFIMELLVFIIIGAIPFSLQGEPIFFYIFAVFCVLGSLLGIWCLPETRGCTLREAQDKFRGMCSKGF
ncbi:hypothetical protein KR222_001632 [Zaprionus bogoriensis]|nr:hypothetical protein KR222_001632 [Zaprionus bogoriensis]